jgi:preprotein translocase subunit SecD
MNEWENNHELRLGTDLNGGTQVRLNRQQKQYLSQYSESWPTFEMCA